LWVAKPPFNVVAEANETKMTNLFTTNTSVSGSIHFPLPIFVGIAFAIVAIVMMFRRHRRK
jgi:hypothetical protein